MPDTKGQEGRWTLGRSKFKWAGQPEPGWYVGRKGESSPNTEYIEVVPASELERCREALERILTLANGIKPSAPIEAIARAALDPKHSEGKPHA